MHAFDSKDLKRLFGIPGSQVRSLIRAGHIHPEKKAGRLSYSFQDLIVLRTLSSLRAANIPAKTINRTLREIRSSLPGELPLSGLSIVAVGDRIVVREGRSLRESESGQYALALEFIDQEGDLLMIDKGAPRSAPAGGRSARNDPAATGAGERGSQGAAGVGSHGDQGAGIVQGAAAERASAAFERGVALEEKDPRGARAAYEACLAEDARHVEARVNLGRLLHLEGRLREAEGVYRGIDAGDPLLKFNLAVLLEDLDREAEAMSAYRNALALDPGLADAHFNLARLHERAGNARDALRHLLAYRRLMNEH
jgi:tetratricopeptide (TPR) repeat protein